MGDRCWLQVTIRGHIDNLPVLEEVVEAIEERGLEHDEEQNLFKAFAHALAFETSPSFSADEVNYANIDDLEMTLQTYEIAYAVEHGSGDDYGAGCWSWSKGQGRCQAAIGSQGDLLLEVSAVERANERGDVATLVEEARAARGKNLPQFSASLELKRHLATMLGVAALRPETV